jgi:hypothetical protein
VQIPGLLYSRIGDVLSLELLFGVREVCEDNKHLVRPYQACQAIVGRYNNRVTSASTLTPLTSLAPTYSFCNFPLLAEICIKSKHMLTYVTCVMPVTVPRMS